jgi:hypothetical protein
MEHHKRLFDRGEIIGIFRVMKKGVKARKVRRADDTLITSLQTRADRFCYLTQRCEGAGYDWFSFSAHVGSFPSVGTDGENDHTLRSHGMWLEYGDYHERRIRSLTSNPTSLCRLVEIADLKVTLQFPIKGLIPNSELVYNICGIPPVLKANVVGRVKKTATVHGSINTDLFLEMEGHHAHFGYTLLSYLNLNWYQKGYYVKSLRRVFLEHALDMLRNVIRNKLLWAEKRVGIAICARCRVITTHFRPISMCESHHHNTFDLCIACSRMLANNVHSGVYKTLELSMIIADHQPSTLNYCIEDFVEFFVLRSMEFLILEKGDKLRCVDPLYLQNYLLFSMDQAYKKMFQPD